MRLSIYFIISLVCLGISTYARSAVLLTAIRQKLANSKPDTHKADLLIELGRYYLNKPGELTGDMDSALLCSRQAKQLSSALKYNAGIGESMLLESQAYRESGEKDKAMRLTKAALQFAVQHHLLKQTADAYLAFCDFFGIENDDLAERIRYTEKALPLYEKGGFRQEEANALKTLGDYYHLQANNPRAIALLERSLSIYRSVRYKEVQGVYDLLGYLYARTGNDVLAIKYGFLAVETARQVQDTSMQLCTIYNRLAITYYGLKKYNEAYAYYQKALDVALHYKDVPSIQQIKFNQVILLMGVHKPQKSLATLIDLVKKYPPGDNTRLRITALSLFAKIYMDMGQLPNSKRYVDSLLFYYNDFGREFGYAPHVNEPIIKYYFLSRQYDKAYPFLKINDSLAQVRHSLNTISTNQLMWSKTDSASGKYISALQHYQQYKTVSDSLKNIDQKKQISGLQYQFDLDNKNRDILMLKQKGLLQQNRINNETVLRNAVIGGLVVLMIICGLIYSRYNVKNKSNQQLTIKQAKINTQNGQLLKLLHEKEWLLKEVHHRVKNNLQIVISLLNTQSAYLDNGDALDAIRNSQHRMQTISLIHQKLYQSENLATIDMSVYIRELVEYLSDSFIKGNNVVVSTNISPVKLDVSQAVPLGLILNEAINNSLKYAFTGKENGRIDIVLLPAGVGKYLMCIADNGVGLPDGFDPYNTSSLGMSLMQGLSQQLDGDFVLENKNGLRVCITFKAMEFNDLINEVA